MRLRQVLLIGPDPSAERAGGVTTHMVNLQKCGRSTTARLRILPIDPRMRLLLVAPWKFRRAAGSLRNAAIIFGTRRPFRLPCC